MESWKLEEYSVESPKWQYLLEKSEIYDFYHTPQYNSLDGTGLPKMLHFQIDETSILFPIIIRDIPNSNYRDVTSSYGYCGPIANKSKISIIHKNNFTNALNAYFKDNKIITAFARLHPLIDNQLDILEGIGEIIGLNKTVAINLSIPESEQRKSYRKSLKYDINKLHKNSIIVREAKSINDLDAFIDIYSENMLRVKASEYYFFSREYFVSFLKNINSILLVAELDNEIIAGAIFTFTTKIMQYHLAGTKNKYIKLAPMKIILDTARQIGSENKMNYLHLGGGVGGKDDSLFLFKSAFSNLNYTFNIWRYIVDKSNYNKLNEKKFGNDLPISNYFPLYRFNN